MSTSSLNGLSILIVDDDEDARDLMYALLSKRGARVIAAESAAAAYEEILCAVPDVLVSDIAMPEADGVSLVLRLRALPPERGGCIPAIAVSAHVGTADRARALAAGFDQYLHKPVDVDKLASAIADATATRRSA